MNALGDILSNLCLASFWGSCLKRCLYQFIREIHLTSCEDHSWGIASTFAFWSYFHFHFYGSYLSTVVRIFCWDILRKI